MIMNINTTQWLLNDAKPLKHSWLDNKLIMLTSYDHDIYI